MPSGFVRHKGLKGLWSAIRLVQTKARWSGNGNFAERPRQPIRINTRGKSNNVAFFDTHPLRRFASAFMIKIAIAGGEGRAVRDLAIFSNSAVDSHRHLDSEGEVAGRSLAGFP